MSSTKEALSFFTHREPSGRETQSSDLTALSSRFTILRELKSADKTRYFLARDFAGDADQLVRVAVLSTDVVEEPSELLAFLVEAQAAARLSHKNIAVSTKPEQIEGIHFYISRYPESAESLRNLLDQKGWFEITPFLKIASQLAHALHYAQQAEVLHLKLQPDDVLIDKDLNVTLTGFGIPSRPARPWGFQKRSRQCPLLYRSPEQLANSHLDERSDLYSLGVLLYEMLTDLLPFNAQDENQLRKKIAIHKAPLAHLIRPDIPEALSAIVAKLIAANPAERFQEAAELRSALAHLTDRFEPETSVQAAPPVSESAQQSEGDPPAENPEEHYEVLPFDFDNESEPLSLDFDDVEEVKNFNGWQPEPLHYDLMLEAPPQDNSPTLSFTSQQSPTDTAPAQLLEEERREHAQIIAVEANRRESFPFALLAIGVAIIMAISGLAYTGNLKGLLNSGSAANQLTSNSDSGVSDINSQAESNSSYQNAVESHSTPTDDQILVAQEMSQALPSNGNPLTVDSQPTDPGTAPESTPPAVETKSPASVPTKPDTTKLREQLRQINRAKATNHKIKKRNARARAIKAKPRRSIFRWRLW